MAIARVQRVTNFSGGTPITVSCTGTAGNSWIVWLRSDHNITSVTDGTNTYTQVAATSVLFGNVFQQCWWCASIAGGTKTVSAASASSTGMDVAVFEYSGGLTTFDQTIANTSNTTSASSGNYTTTIANELMMGQWACFGNSFSSAGTGWSLNGAAYGFSTNVEDQIVSATGTYACTATVQASTTWQVLVATFGVSGGTPTSDVVPMTGGGRRVIDLPHYRMDGTRVPSERRLRGDEVGARRYLERQRGRSLHASP